MQGRRARCLDCISSIQSLAVWTLARRTIVGRAAHAADVYVGGTCPIAVRGGLREAVRSESVSLLSVCSQFMFAATNSSQPGPRRILVHSYHVLVESCAFSKTGGLFCSHLFEKLPSHK